MMTLGIARPAGESATDSEGTSTVWIICIVLFLSSLLVRGLALWVFPVEHLGTNAVLAYLGGADRILNGNGLMDSDYPVFTPPLYAILIAIGRSIFGVDRLPIEILQILADSVTTVILFQIVRGMTGFRAAALTGGILVVYPFSVYASLYIGSETLFTFFLACSTMTLMWAVSLSSILWYVVAGALLGIATLIRGTTQFFPFVIPLLLILVCKRINKHVIAGYLTLCLTFAICLAPWAIRNYLVLGAFVPVATTSSVFLQGSAKEFLTIDGKIKEFPPYLSSIEKRGIHAPSHQAGAVAYDRYIFKAGIERYIIRAETDPLSFIPFLLTKFAHLWYATESGSNQGAIVLINLPLYIFAIVGTVYSIRWKLCNQGAGIIIGLIGYFTFLHWVSLPLFRYMLPIMPYVISFASVGILVILEWLSLTELEKPHKI